MVCDSYGPPSGPPPSQGYQSYSGNIEVILIYTSSDCKGEKIAVPICLRHKSKHMAQLSKGQIISRRNHISNTPSAQEGRKHFV